MSYIYVCICVSWGDTSSSLYIRHKFIAKKWQLQILYMYVYVCMCVDKMNYHQ